MVVKSLFCMTAAWNKSRAVIERDGPYSRDNATVRTMDYLR